MQRMIPDTPIVFITINQEHAVEPCSMDALHGIVKRIRKRNEGMEMTEKKTKSGIFREKSMERVSSPEVLDDYVRVTTPSVWIVLIALAVLLAGALVWLTIGSRGAAAPLRYAEFKSLSAQEQKQTFAKLSGTQVYALVADSDESWPVTSYDLISPDNAKETIVLYDNNGDLHFNLAWPCYGGFLPESIASMGELSGTLEVSRDGGDGGHSMSYGRNTDGSYPNDSQRSVPKSSAGVRTGVLDVDRYLQVLDIVTNGESEDSRLSKLREMGYDSDISARFLADAAAFPSRDEISGPDNINDGAVSVGHTVESKYGYYGITAPWTAGDLKLEGGAGQLCTVFSWGTLCASGLIYDTGTAEIH